jgi:hypothetical protein
MSSFYLDDCSTPTRIVSYRTSERKLISTTSTQDARSSSCTLSFVCWRPKRARVYSDERRGDKREVGILA